MTFTAMAGLLVCLAAAPTAEAVQSDLVKVCVDSAGRQTAVRYIAGRQVCTNGRKTLFLDRPGYSPRDFAARASDEIDECTEADSFVDSRENEITLCVGILEVGPPDDTVLQCAIWLDGADEYLVASNSLEPAGFLATPEGNNIFASVQQATPGAHGGAARDITFFHPDDGYVIEVDLEFLIWPSEGACVAVGRASNAPLSSRD
jgi:hypothetical protein